ncbi:hypothetical protein [Streptomyces microflavus]|uniref:hypothetical protein n=1 Tax=Streptomyces microflavus TaxID=1919 RepID=UPI003685D998
MIIMRRTVTALLGAAFIMGTLTSAASAADEIHESHTGSHPCDHVDENDRASVFACQQSMEEQLTPEERAELDHHRELNAALIADNKQSPRGFGRDVVIGADSE